MNSSEHAGDRVIVKLEHARKPNAKSGGMKRSSMWRKCEFDTGESLKIPEEIVFREQLVKEMTVSQSLYEKIKSESELVSGKEKVFRLLAYRSRSENELKQRLRQTGLKTVSADKIINDFKRLNLVDDEQFALNFVHDLVLRKPSGEFLIRSELKKKGIAEEIINKVIEQEFNENKQVELAQKSVRQWISRHPGSGTADPSERHKKIAKFLYQRGFTWTTIELVLGDSNAFA